MGAVVNGDESYGFTPAFLASGARNVIATLWPIDDASTAVLMHRFYTELSSQRIAGALQQAQRDMIAGGTYADPFYWAAFELVGDDRVMPAGNFADLNVPEPVYLRAAELRAQFGLRTADALPVACAEHHRCDELWTNDDRLAQASPGLALRVVQR
jgi:hypothetical protein